MKDKGRFFLITTIVGAALAGLALGRITSPSHTPSAQNLGTTEEEETIWTCSMHPQIQQPEPGDCPICAMDLIPLEDDAGSDAGNPRELTLSPRAAALAQVQTHTVERRFPEARVQLFGKLGYDETRLKSLTARFPARIERLFVNYTGVPVEEGEHLARVYSPELLTAQQELLTAVKYDPNSPAARAAREKLRLWDLTDEQIRRIIDSGQAKDNFQLQAPVGGVVVEKNVREGDYLQTGQNLFKIADLNQLWLYLEAYETDLPWLRLGQPVTFQVKSLPGQEFEGRIAFIEPVLDERTRTVDVRVVVPNQDRRLKPGMLAEARVTPQLSGEGQVYSPRMAGKFVSPMHPWIVKEQPGDCDVCGMPLLPAEELGYTETEEGRAPLVIPASAVLQTGERAVVYLAKNDGENGLPTKFEGREITLGPRAQDFYLVQEGLEEGDRVVTQGAFKIDSALQIQARPSMMMADAESAEDAGSTAPQVPRAEPVEITPEQAQKILPSYFDLTQALANDDLEAAKAALRAMMEITGHVGPLPDLIHTLLAAESLDALRRPHYESLSMSLIPVVENNPAKFSDLGPIYRAYCPMVYTTPDDEYVRADWLQPTDQLRNPYFGDEMLTCGTVEKNLTE